MLERGVGAALLVAAGPVGRVAIASAGGSRDPRLRALARAVAGPVLKPGSSGYEAARLPYNRRFDGVRPLAVVRPRNAADVRAVVRWAERTGVRIAARSGGHSYAGYSTTRGVVVDLSDLDGIHVGRDGQATVGAGARLIDVYAALARRGRGIPAGSCPTVGIAGLALGGGFGLASRAWGLTADNLTALELVTASGRLLRCDRHRHADLFWACRGGGGGNFGIATRFRFRTHAVGSASSFVASWKWSDADDVLAAWQQWAPHAPDRLTALARLATGPQGPTVLAFGQYLGSQQNLAALVAQLTSKVPAQHVTFGHASWLDLQLRWAGCAGKPLEQCHLAPRGTLSRSAFAAKSDYVNRPLRRAGRRTLKHWVERRQNEGAAGVILLDAYGGAVDRVPKRATAFVHRDALYSCQYFTSWGPAADAASALAWVRGVKAAMRPYVSGFAYQNYIDPDLASWRHAYYGVNLARLQAVRRRYDPNRLFRFPQAI